MRTVYWFPSVCWFVIASCTAAPATEPSPDASDASDASVATGPTRALGQVSGDGPVTCPQDAPLGALCQHITVDGCPELATEPLGATVAILSPGAAGTILHFKGGGGQGFLTPGSDTYAAAGYQQMFVSWDDDWEQTSAAGIKAAACRPATVIKWAFDTLHAGSRSTAFCGEGKSGGSAQLGYALTHYGLADYLDYVTEWAGPPFARIDLGCDGDAPPTATVCGETVTMQLPPKVTAWENIRAPLSCGSTNVPAAELARWKNDSIAYGGHYDYPQTRVEFFACTYNAPAVAGMAKQFHDVIAATSTGTAFHCYSQADGCQGEGLGTRGDTEREQAMLAGCTPRHR